MELPRECEIIDQRPTLTADSLMQQTQTQQQQQQQPQQSITTSNLPASSTSAAAAGAASSAATTASAVGVNTPVSSALGGIHSNAAIVPAGNKPNILSEGEAGSQRISTATEEQVSRKEALAVNLDIDVLPLIHDIIRCIEKETDNASRQREAHECGLKILELQKRFDVARERVQQLPGIDYNPQEQSNRMEILYQQLILKQQLIRKYKNMKY